MRDRLESELQDAVVLSREVDRLPNVSCFAFGCGSINGNPNAFYTLTKFDAQELRIGVRFMLTPDVAPAPLYAPPPPVMRKG